MAPASEPGGRQGVAADFNRAVQERSSIVAEHHQPELTARQRDVLVLEYLGFEAGDIANLLGPITGYCTSDIPNGLYCPGVGGGAHAITGGTGFGKQLDLVTSTAGLQQIDFNGSSNIASIRVTNRSNMCRDTKVTSPWKNALDIEMFTGINCGGSWIGTVRFGHISSWVPDTYYNTINGRVTYVGQITEAPCSCDPSLCDSYYESPSVWR